VFALHNLVPFILHKVFSPNQLTNSTKQNLPRQADSSSTSEEMFGMSWNRTAGYHLDVLHSPDIVLLCIRTQPGTLTGFYIS
jgi:hypothetical protein